MKKDLHHKDYRLVVFYDEQADYKLLTHSTAASSETIKWEDGNEYPLINVHISSASHPFYTGEQKVLDIEGRVDKFKARQEQAKARAAALSSKAKKLVKKSEKKVKKEADKKPAPVKPSK